MIGTVLFDIGGAPEDIYVDDASKDASAAEVLRILKAHGLERPDEAVVSARQKLSDGWDRYAAYRAAPRTVS